MKKRLLSMVLALALCLSLLPAVALAADEIEPENKSAGWVVDFPTDLPQTDTTFTAGGGSMLWEPVVEDGKVTRGTLTLNNVTIQAAQKGIALPVPVTVVLQGSNSITTTQNSGTGTTGIGLIDNTAPLKDASNRDYYPEQALTIQGPGSLTINSVGGGLDGSSITIENGAEISIECQVPNTSINTSNGDITIRSSSTVKVKITGSNASIGAIYANDTVSDSIDGGNVIIENSRVVALNDSGPAIAAGTASGNVTFTNSDVVAIGNNSSDYGVVTGGGSKTISSGTLYVKNNSVSNYDLSFYFTATDSAVIYYSGANYNWIQQGNNVQYESCTYDENTGAITVGNGYVMGEVEWNENILFTQGKNLYLRNYIGGAWIPGTITIPSGTEATIPANGYLTNYGSFINNGTLHVEGMVDNYATVTNNGILNITGYFCNNIYGNYSGSLAGDGTTNGITIDYYSALARTYVAHADAVMGYNITLGERYGTDSSGNTVTGSFKAEIPGAATLTIPANGTLDASTNGITAENLSQYYTNNGTLIVEGTALFPEGTDLSSLGNISGSGTIKAGQTEYHIVNFDSQGGSAVATQFVPDGEAATPPANPTRDGFTFDGWYTDAGCTQAYDFSAAITQNMTLYANWVERQPVTPVVPPYTPPAAATYPPEVDDTDNGSVSVTPARPSRGDKVTITPKPDAGYEVETVTVTDQNGDRVKVSRNADGTYSFIQPAGKVTVSVQFACNGGRYCPSRAFSDLDTSQWYHKATDFVIESGLMNGSGGKFYPDDVLTRAELAQILYNAEGKPAVSGQSAFTDIKTNAWYFDAVVWASGNGIVTGFSDDTFRPDEPITREQLAAMLYRYAQYKRYDTTLGGMAIREFSDYASISSYAASAMTWAVNTGVVGGFPDNTLRPQGSATRAQAAQMLKNFFENPAR